MLAATARSLAERAARARTTIPSVSRALSDAANAASASSTTDSSTKSVRDKPKRDMTNPVVVESIRRKKLAKGIVDDRLPPPALCETCGRRFCRCEGTAKAPPRRPLETDCCHSDPRCAQCVFVVYDELQREWEATRQKS
jgi:hypothetical protein